MAAWGDLKACVCVCLCFAASGTPNARSSTTYRSHNILACLPDFLTISKGLRQVSNESATVMIWIKQATHETNETAQCYDLLISTVQAIVLIQPVIVSCVFWLLEDYNLFSDSSHGESTLSSFFWFVIDPNGSWWPQNHTCRSTRDWLVKPLSALSLRVLVRIPWGYPTVLPGAPSGESCVNPDRLDVFAE